MPGSSADAEFVVRLTRRAARKHRELRDHRGDAYNIVARQLKYLGRNPRGYRKHDPGWRLSFFICKHTVIVWNVYHRFDPRQSRFP